MRVIFHVLSQKVSKLALQPTSSSTAKLVTSADNLPPQLWLVDFSHPYPTFTHVSALSGHEFNVKVITWSPKGKFLITACDYPILWVETGNTIKSLGKLHHERSEVHAAEWSPDEKRVAFATQNNVVALYDIETKQQVKRLTLEYVPVGMCWDPLNSYISVLTTENCISIYTSNTLDIKKKIPLNIGAGAFSDTKTKRLERKISWSTEGEFCVCPSLEDRNEIPILCGINRIRNFEITNVFAGPSAAITCVSFLDGLYKRDKELYSVFAMGDSDGNISIWQTKGDSKPLYYIKGGDEDMSIESICWEPQSRKVFASTTKKFIVMIDYNPMDFGTPLADAEKKSVIENLYGKTTLVLSQTQSYLDQRNNQSQSTLNLGDTNPILESAMNSMNAMTAGSTSSSMMQTQGTVVGMQPKKIEIRRKGDPVKPKEVKEVKETKEGSESAQKESSKPIMRAMVADIQGKEDDGAAKTQEGGEKDKEKEKEKKKAKKEKRRNSEMEAEKEKDKDKEKEEKKEKEKEKEKELEKSGAMEVEEEKTPHKDASKSAEDKSPKKEVRLRPKTSLGHSLEVVPQAEKICFPRLKQGLENFKMNLIEKNVLTIKTEKKVVEGSEVATSKLMCLGTMGPNLTETVWTDFVEGKVLLVDHNSDYLVYYTDGHLLYINNIHTGKKQELPLMIPNLARIKLNAKNFIMLIREDGELKVYNFEEKKVILQENCYSLIKELSSTTPPTAESIYLDDDGIPYICLRPNLVVFYNAELKAWQKVDGGVFSFGIFKNIPKPFKSQINSSVMMMNKTPKDKFEDFIKEIAGGEINPEKLKYDNRVTVVRKIEEAMIYAMTRNDLKAYYMLAGTYIEKLVDFHEFNKIRCFIIEDLLKNSNSKDYKFIKANCPKDEDFRKFITFLRGKINSNQDIVVNLRSEIDAVVENLNYSNIFKK